MTTPNQAHMITVGVTPAQLDRFAELHGQVKRFAPIVREYDGLARAIRAEQNGILQPAECGIIDGSAYSILVGARENERHLPTEIRKVVKACGGLPAFYTIAAVPLGKLEALIGKPAVAQLVTLERTGSRSLEVVAKLPTSLKKAA